MGGYIANFTVYTMAMLGLICFALFVYKKFANGNTNNKSKFLGIEECISLAPRKNLYIVRAGTERFLIASDVDKTNLISKLDDNSKPQRFEKQPDAEDLPVIVDFPQKPVIKEMLKKINQI